MNFLTVKLSFRHVCKNSPNSSSKRRVVHNIRFFRQFYQNKVWQKYNVYIYYYCSYSRCIHYIFARLYSIYPAEEAQSWWSSPLHIDPTSPALKYQQDVSEKSTGALTLSEFYEFDLIFQIIGREQLWLFWYVVESGQVKFPIICR